MAKATTQDNVLAKVRFHTLHGWPNYVSEEDLKPYVQRSSELSIENDCVHWGLRVVIPHSLQGTMLQQLHSVHMGIVKMKAIARSHFWWPGLDRQIEELISGCPQCQLNRNLPQKAPAHPWKWADRPWQRLHVDFCEKNGRMFFVLLDAYFRWAEVEMMSTTTTSNMIDVLRRLFAAYGLPEEVISDNGPQFSAAEFAEFVKANAIKHTTSALTVHRVMVLLKGWCRLLSLTWKNKRIQQGHGNTKLQIFYLHTALLLMLLLGKHQ